MRLDELAELPRLVLKRDEAFLVADRRGDVPGLPGAPFGFYVEGTRFLSQLELRVAGERPVLLHAEVDRAAVQIVAELTNPELVLEGRRAPAGVLRLSRLLTLEGPHLYDVLVVESFAPEPLALEVGWRVAADFADVLEVRGHARPRRGEVVPPRAGRAGLELAYRGRDRVRRTTRVAVEPAPTRVDRDIVAYRLRLAPRERATVRLTATAGCAGACPPAPPLADVLGRRAEAPTPVAVDVRSDDRLFDRWLDRARTDLGLLLTATPMQVHPVEVWDLLVQLGLAGRVELHLNSIGDRVCRPPYRERLVAYLRAHADRLCAECVERIERNPLRVLDCKQPGCRPVLEGAPVVLDALCAECAGQFARLRRYLEAMGLAYTVNPRLVRGLDYYVRTTFEVIAPELGAQNAVAGGGRYDGLVERLGGPPDPGTGFAVGMERLVLLLADTAVETRPLAALIPLGEEALCRLLPVAQAVRAAGVPVELAPGTRKLRHELDRANRLGAAWAVIVGPDELARGEALLREMKAGTQRTVALGALAAELLALGGRG